MKPMPAEYRVLQYVADPFSGLCFAVAALVRDGSGAVTVVPAPTIPGPEATGSARATNLLRALWDRIAKLDSFDRLPRSFGPQFVLSGVKAVPSEDAAAWVEERLFAKAA